MLREAWFAITHPVSICLLCLGLVSIIFRKRWFILLCAAAYSFSTMIITADLAEDPTGIRAFAIREGCIGPPHLSIALFAAITALMLWIAIKRPRRQE